MAKVSFSTIESRVSFESVAAVSARVMQEAAKAATDSDKLAIMQAGFVAMQEAEKAKDKIFSLVERCNLLQVTDGDVSAFWSFLLRFYDFKRAREVFTDFLVKVAEDTRRIVKTDDGKWIADNTRDYYPAKAEDKTTGDGDGESVAADDSGDDSATDEATTEDGESK